MTVSTTEVRKQYAGNGTTQAFPIPFPYNIDSNIRVVLTDTAVLPELDVELSLQTHYTISGDGQSGTVNILSAPTADQRVTIVREVPYQQLLDLQNNGIFVAEDIERAGFDNLEMQIQQVNELVSSRSLQLPVTALGAVSNILPPPQANSILQWDSLGTSLVNTTLFEQGVNQVVTLPDGSISEAKLGFNRHAPKIQLLNPGVNLVGAADTGTKFVYSPEGPTEPAGVDIAFIQLPAPTDGLYYEFYNAYKLSNNGVFRIGYLAGDINVSEDVSSEQFVAVTSVLAPDNVTIIGGVDIRVGGRVQVLAMLGEWYIYINYVNHSRGLGHKGQNYQDVTASRSPLQTSISPIYYNNTGAAIEVIATFSTSNTPGSPSDLVHGSVSNVGSTVAPSFVTAVDVTPERDAILRMLVPDEKFYFIQDYNDPVNPTVTLESWIELR